MTFQEAFLVVSIVNTGILTGIFYKMGGFNKGIEFLREEVKAIKDEMKILKTKIYGE